jgi:hypothetical protein
MPKLKQKETGIKFKPINNKSEHLFHRVSAKIAEMEDGALDESDAKIARDWSELADQIVGCEIGLSQKQG